MAGFRKAKAEQAALKAAIFGPAGSGKTFSALLLAEGLARLDGTRVAYVDTERGTDFYSQPVPGRRFHPEAFDFDALYTRSITEINQSLFALKRSEHGVAVVDSMSHVWEAAINSYNGRKVGGKIPFHAWSQIKAPYKALMQWMLSTDLHVFLLGRQANEWGQDDESGESVAKGVKMRAEGETAYEPHILIRMEGVKPMRADGKSVQVNAEPVPTMFVIKDRTGLLQGKVIEYPTFDKVVAPLLPLLGKSQARMQTDDEAALADSAAIADAGRAKAHRSAELRRTYLARFQLAVGSSEAIERIVKELTPEVKKEMSKQDLDAVREGYLKAAAGQPVAADPPAAQAEE